MQFRISVVGMDQQYPRWREMVGICDYLGMDLSQRDYGPGVAKLNMYVMISAQSETGIARPVKYGKAARLLEVTFNLNGRDVWLITSLHRFSIVVWSIWLIPYLTGLFVSMR